MWWSGSIAGRVCPMSDNRSAGFTLLEAVFALAVLGMMSVAVLTMVSTGLRTAGRSNESLEVAALAQDRLARARLSVVGGPGDLPDSLRAGSFAAPFTGYRWSASVHPVLGERDLYELSVQVRWESGAYRLATRVYRPPRTSGSAS